MHAFLTKADRTIAHRAALKAGLGEQDAHDCVSEFLFRRREGVDTNPGFATVCARNHARDFARAVRRHAARRDALDEAIADAESRIEDAIVVEERRRALSLALDGLSPEARRLVVRHHLEDAPIAEVARELGISESAVEGRLHRARAALARRLTALGWGGGVIFSGLPKKVRKPARSQVVLQSWKRETPKRRVPP